MVERDKLQALIQKQQQQQQKSGGGGDNDDDDATALRLRDIEECFAFPIDRFQKDAIGALLREKNVMVAAPTGSGKTLIGEAAAIAALARGRRAFYTTPLKALSNQKLREFAGKFGDDRVGLITGDGSLNSDADVVVMTAEIFRNMLYTDAKIAEQSGKDGKAEESRLANVDYVVLDEVHYLNDPFRGTTWEEIIIYCPKHIKVICLSATVPNAQQLSDWISEVHGPTQCISTEHRPVPLQWYYSIRSTRKEDGDGLFPLLDTERAPKKERKKRSSSLAQRNRRKQAKKDDGNRIVINPRLRRRLENLGVYRGDREYYSDSGSDSDGFEWPYVKSMKRKCTPLITTVLRQLQKRDWLPALFFIFSRRICDQVVAESGSINLLSKAEQAQVILALRQLRESNPDAVRESAVQPLMRGIASHHAGCLPAWKLFIEQLFQRNLLKVVIATETLAAGINMPARATVIKSCAKNVGGMISPLPCAAMMQMAGRAGRRGLDTEGRVVVLQSPFEGAAEAIAILAKGAEPLQSQFTVDYGMTLGLLQSYGIDEAKSLVEKSFGNYLGTKGLEKTKTSLSDLLQRIDAQKEKMAELAQRHQHIKDLDQAETAAADLETKLSDLIWERREALKSMLSKEAGPLDKGERAIVVIATPPLEKGSPGVRYVRAIAARVRRIHDSEWSEHSHEVQDRAPDSSDLGSDSVLMADMDDRNDLECLGEDGRWYRICVEDAVFVSSQAVAMSRAILDSRPSDGDPWTYLSGGHDGWMWDSVMVSESVQDRPEITELLTRAFPTDRQLDGLPGEFRTAQPPARLLGLKPMRERFSARSYGDFARGLGDVLSSRYGLERGRLDRHHHRGIQSALLAAEGAAAARDAARDAMGKEDSKAYRRFRDLKRRAGELKKEADMLEREIAEYEPVGWDDFECILAVLKQVEAIRMRTRGRQLKPHFNELGSNAAKLRGENVLFLAMCLCPGVDSEFIQKEHKLKPSQFAAVACSLVTRDCVGGRDVRIDFPATRQVNVVVRELSEIAEKLDKVQELHGIKLSTEIDSRFTGLVEAWANGQSWNDISEECDLHEGDLARLLRRTIDLLSQIRELPYVTTETREVARAAKKQMDRPPISEMF